MLQELASLLAWVPISQKRGDSQQLDTFAIFFSEVKSSLIRSSYMLPTVNISLELFL